MDEADGDEAGLTGTTDTVATGTTDTPTDATDSTDPGAADTTGSADGRVSGTVDAGDADAGDPSVGAEATGRARRRRWPFVIGGVLVVLAVGGLLARFVWLPHYRPDLEPGERYGLDVSNHQGEIDWEQVAGDNIDFAYIKATEGGDFVDKSFERNWKGAAANDLDRGAYHFFTLCKPGAEQAANFLRTVPLDPDDLPPAIDLELGGNCADRPDQAWLDRELGDFIDEVESATGKRAVLYVGPEFEDIYPIKEKLARPLWDRRLLLRPGDDGWWTWQFHSFGSVDGVDGPVDINVMIGTEPPAS